MNTSITNSSIGLALAGALFSLNATAATIVTNWSYVSTTEFDTTQTVFGTGTGTQTNTSSELSWGATGGFFQNTDGDISDGNRSALTIGNGLDGSLTGGAAAVGNITTTLDGTVDDNPLGEIGITNNVTHWNNVIDSDFATLSSGRTSSALQLTPTLPSTGATITPVTLIFDFDFIETPNAGDANGQCAASSTGPVTSPCGDIFAITSLPALNQQFSYDLGDGPVTYFASLLITDEDGGASPLQPLSDERCAAAGAASGCIGWYTEENAPTTVQFAFSISTEPVFVPEPGTLALLGLGLAGFGVARRRAKR